MNTRTLVVMLAAVFLSTGVAMAQTEWVVHPDSPVIDPGPPGSWDDTARAPLAVHFDGSVYHLWFVGNNTSLEHGDIGHATSTDGVEWTMDPANPVLTRGEPGDWDDDFMWGAGVVHDGTQYHLWYAGRNAQTGTYRGGYATSPDGTVWTKHPDNPVLTPGPVGAWDDGAVDPHTVILENGTYRMWYSGSDGTFWQTGYAESADGVHWTKHPTPVLEVGRYPGAWDSSVAENSFVVFDGATYHMFYTGGDGNATSIGYAFSGDGKYWTKHEGNWVHTGYEGITTNSPIYFDGETFHMWYTQGFNSDGTFRVMYATSDCCAGVAALDNWQYIPAAAVASGAEGAFYQTDVDISNSDDQMAEYGFSWLPRGVDNSEPTRSETFSLDAGKSARYTNVLAEVFDLEPDSLGALAIMSSSPGLLAMSRTYNIPGEKVGGTFGQSMPALATDTFIAHGETRRILFGTEGADMRTNIGCQNGTNTTTVVFLDLFGADGTSLGRQNMMLRAHGNDQINRIFDGHNPVNGYVDVTPAQAGNLVYCYGSVLDNVTSDPTTIPPQ